MKYIIDTLGCKVNQYETQAMEALLAELAASGDWQEGQRFRSGASQADVTAWVESLNLA